MTECPTCEGRGYLMAPMPVSDGCGGCEYDPSPTPCSTCDGSGETKSGTTPQKETSNGS